MEKNEKIVEAKVVETENGVEATVEKEKLPKRVLKWAKRNKKKIAIGGLGLLTVGGVIYKIVKGKGDSGGIGEIPLLEDMTGSDVISETVESVAETIE